MNWGFLGYGGIAPVFQASLDEVKHQKLVAVASKSGSPTLTTGTGRIKTYDQYESLLEDNDVEIVYISTTHNYHFENVLSALDHGKHVLCEKPLGLSADQVVEMTAFANEKKLFLMEALWTKFLPAFEHAMQVVHSGRLGQIRMVRSDFGLGRTRDDRSRLWNPQLAGGSLYDLGVYNIFLANQVFGSEPSTIDARARVLDTGIDEYMSLQFQYSDGGVAQLFSSLSLKTAWDGIIYGENGSIVMKEFFKCQDMAIEINGETSQVALPFRSTGYYHEIVHVVDCIQTGRLESPLFSHQDSLNSAMLVDKALGKVNYGKI